MSESYLVSTCALMPTQSRKASRSLTKLATPYRVDAVADLDLSKSDAASTIYRSPRIFCSEVDETLAPCVSQLRDMGLSTLEIARLVPLVPSVFVSPKHISRLSFYMSFLGLFDRVLNAIKRNNSLLGCSVEDALNPNFEFLRLCGLSDRDIA